MVSFSSSSPPHSMARPKRLCSFIPILCASFSNVHKHLAYNIRMPIRHLLSSPFHAPASFYLRSLLLSVFILLAGCSSATPAPVPTLAPAGGSCSLPEAADDESSIRALLVAEGEFVVAQNIDALMRLWADDATVADAKNTPDQWRR